MGLLWGFHPKFAKIKRIYPKSAKLKINKFRYLNTIRRLGSSGDLPSNPQVARSSRAGRARFSSLFLIGLAFFPFLILILQ